MLFLIALETLTPKRLQLNPETGPRRTYEPLYEL